MPTLIFEDKFNTGGTWDSSGGTPIIGTSPAPPSAAHSLQCNAIGDFVLWNIPDSGFTRCVLGVWLWVDTDPAGDSRCFKIDAGTSEGWWGLHPVVTPDKIEYSIRSDGTPSISTVFSGSAGAWNLQSWEWCQFMYDVSADPWQIRGRMADNIISSTAAAAASNLNPGNFVLGNTAGGSTYTAYFGHVKAGVAADDDDWWTEPTGSQPADDAPISRLGRGAGW